MSAHSMRNPAGPPPVTATPDGALHLPGVLEVVVRAVADALTARNGQEASPGETVSGKPLLDLEETAELLGVSRMTIARMADEGRLPSVVIRRGRVQKTRRIPRAFVDRMVADACAGAQVDMEAYAAAWLAEHGPACGVPDGG